MIGLVLVFDPTELRDASSSRGEHGNGGYGSGELNDDECGTGSSTMVGAAAGSGDGKSGAGESS